MSGNGISWATCKSAPRSRQITTPAPHHSVFFTGRIPFLPPNQQRQRTEGTGNKSVPQIVIDYNNKFISFKTAISILVIQTITVSDCCLIKLLRYILFEKYIYILALEMAMP